MGSGEKNQQLKLMLGGCEEQVSERRGKDAVKKRSLLLNRRLGDREAGTLRGLERGGALEWYKPKISVSFSTPSHLLFLLPCSPQLMTHTAQNTGLGPSQDPCLLLLAGDYATDRLCDPGKAEPRSWPWAADGAGPPRAHRAGPPGALRGSVPLNFVFP